MNSGDSTTIWYEMDDDFIVTGTQRYDYDYDFLEDKPIPDRQERRSFEHVSNIKGKNYERNLHTVKTLHKSSRNREHKYLRQLPDIKRK